MKNIRSLSLATFACMLCATACFNPKGDQALAEVAPKVGTGQGIIRKEMPVTAEQKVILKKLEQNVPNPRRGKPLPEASLKHYAPDWSEMTFTTLPYYDIDWTEFDASENPDKLLKCIKPVENGILFLGRLKGEPVLLIDAFEVDGEWWYTQCAQGQNLGRILAWLPARLAGADPDNYYCLPLAPHWMFVLHYDGRPEFYEKTGDQSYDAQGLTEILDASKKTRHANREFSDRERAKYGFPPVRSLQDEARAKKLNSERAKKEQREYWEKKKK